MALEVKYLPKQDIERNAERVLAEYGEKFGRVSRPPVPVEEILEAHLKLTLEIDDLASRLGFPDIHGALWVPERLVAVDKRIEPTAYPNKEGRFFYTLGHEIGHWELHRHYFTSNPDQFEMFPGLRKEPSVICRTSMAKERIEWQADHFSANLLMPKSMVCTVWGELIANLPRNRFNFDVRKLGDGALPSGVIEFAVRELALRFKVSGQAMKIRLAELQLLPSAMLPLFQNGGPADFVGDGV